LFCETPRVPRKRKQSGDEEGAGEGDDEEDGGEQQPGDNASNDEGKVGGARVLPLAGAGAGSVGGKPPPSHAPQLHSLRWQLSHIPL